MMTWNDLTKDQQTQAIKRNLKNLSLLLIDGVLKLDAPRQAKLDEIVEHSGNLEVAVKRIFDSALGKELYTMAVTASEDAMYNSQGMQMTVDNFEENFPLFV